MNIFNLKKEENINQNLVLEAIPGEHIEEYAQRLIELFRQVQQRVLFVVAIAGENKKKPLTVYGKFNDVDLFVTLNSTVSTIIESFNDGFAENQKKYRESEEYKCKQKERDAEVIRLNAEMQRLLKTLTTLDFSNIEAVVKWFMSFIPLADDVDVNTSISDVLSIMKKNDFLPNANTGHNFIENDKDNHAHWLIGYTLASLENNGTVNPRIILNYETWVEKFCKTT